QGTIQVGDPVSFSVPTGNFGDVLAGYYASLLGLPVKTFYVASNANNVLTDFLETGIYDRRRPFIQTISPSMDILISSNLERLLYYASNKDQAKVAKWMDDLATQGYYELDEETKQAIQSQFKGGYYDDAALKETIAKTYQDTGYVLDPHTAAAYALAKDALASGEKGPIIALSTASPYKFTQDVLDALGLQEDNPWVAMQKLSEIDADPIPTPLAQLPEAPILHTAVITPSEMKDNVAKAAQEIFA
ncbi:MAG: threonine synthase, partial [Allobaculum sp.]|nr:threonine synthase [Allobaculum sp.]